MGTQRSEQLLTERAEADSAAPGRDLALEQRMRSLGQANEIRAARATLKHKLASGQARIEHVLAQPPAFAATAKVTELLLALPGFGPARVTRALTRCQIPHAKTVTGLSTRQRLALITLLDQRRQTFGGAVADARIPDLAG